jgi:uncharacterized membrane protein
MSAVNTIAALRFAPLVPLWLLGLLALAALIALAPALWRRARGVWWRLAAFLVLLLWLAGPRLVQETRQGLSDIALLVVDHSASMAIGERAALADAARARLVEDAAKFPDLELRSVIVPDTGHDGTQLFAAARRALADIPESRRAGIIAITDGEVHDIPAKPDWGTAPLQVLIPAKGEETDRSLRVIDAPGYGIVGHSVSMRIEIDDLGVAHPARETALTLRRDGEPPRILQAPIGRPYDIEIPITRAGPTVIDLQAAPLPGAVTALNARAVVTINGVRDRLRVLLVSGEPHPGERTWRRLLKADPAVDLVHFTILRPPEKDDLTPLNELALIAFPVRELFQVKINQFDLIILDRFQSRGILPMIYLQNIADYVRRGGALLMSVGPEFAGPGSLSATPLADILPAEPAEGEDAVVNGAFRPQVTALGERHPVTAALPGWHEGAAPSWGSWYRHIAVSDVHGQTVMQTPDGQPLLLLDHVGKGRVALLLSDQIWLWSRGHQGGGPQAELLRRVAHWLMKEPELEENSLSARITDGRLVIESRSLAAHLPGVVRVTDPKGKTVEVALTEVAPGRTQATLPASAPGVWRAEEGGRTAFAAANGGDPLEMADLRATATKLAPLVAASGGSIHWLDPAGAPALHRTEPAASQAGAHWIGLRRNHAHIVTGIAALPLLPNPAALSIILALMLIAWREEGR